MTQTIEVANVNNAGQELANKTVLVKVTFGSLGNQRKLKASQYSVEADKSMTSATKKLLDSEELDAIRSADGHVRQWIYNNCLPFEEGVHLIPLGMIPLVEGKLRTYRTERAALVQKFADKYSELRADAQTRLNGLFNAKDYPDVLEVASSFNFTWQYISLGVPGALQEIDAELFAQEAGKAQAKMTEAVEEITAVMRGTLANLVTHLRDTLTDNPDGKRKKFYDTTVTKLQDFLSTFSFRNVTNDADLAEQVNKVRALLDGTSIEALRTTDTLRDRVRSGMTEVTAKLETLVSARPRMFRDEE